jgi:putative phosphoesterase
MRIGLLSDTHSHVDERMLEHLKSCDEIWHAGDIGSAKVTDALAQIAPLRAVHGNIDGHELRVVFPEDLRFNCEGLDVWITHIGGYPGKYAPRVRERLIADPPNLFICGHSHILKVIPDNKLNILHMNPGAAGKEGFHQVRTILRFDIVAGKISNLEVVELGLRAALS